MTQSEWENENQEDLKDAYFWIKLSGENPNLNVWMKICAGCRKSFYTMNTFRKYCGNCMQNGVGLKLAKKRKRLENRTNIICKTCGKKFTPKRADAAYCSNACRQKAYRMRDMNKIRDT